MKSTASANRERGFAMLLVFAMAGAVAILLYKELPRLIFESQRIKEDELIYRGEQYSRAIQLYVRKNKKYPQTLDDLEKGGDIRFLRRKYKDPMTGKDEWRLIHIDNGGFYTDSLVHKPKDKDGEKKSQNTFITEGASFGSTGPAPGEGQGQGRAFRGASDRPAATAEQFSGPSGFVPQPGAEGSQEGEQPQEQEQVDQSAIDQQQQQDQIQEPEQPTDPAAEQFQDPANQQQDFQQQQQNPPYPPGVVPYGVPGQPNSGPVGGGPTGRAYPSPFPQGQQGNYPTGYQQQQPYPPQANPYQQMGLPQYMGRQGAAMGGQARPYPPQGIPGLPGPYGQQPYGQPPYGQQPNPQQNQGLGMPPGVAPQPQQGMNQAANNPAISSIMNQLTSARPGGLQGTEGAAGGMGGIPGGIAGVASKLETKGIMIYNEKSKYNEWEFLYDMKKEQEKAAAAAAGQMGAGAEGQPGVGGNQSQSSFGQSGFGQSGFGQQQQQGNQNSPFTFGGGGSGGAGGARSNSSGSGSTFGSGYSGSSTPPPPQQMPPPQQQVPQNRPGGTTRR